MSSYHAKFSYLNKNSKDNFNWRITHFEPDQGEMESGLSQEQIYADMYNGKRRLLYGTKYNSTANIKITVVKHDYSDFSVSECRDAYRWLTGSPTANWLDLYVGDELKYSFLCTVQDVKPEKLDSRTVGLHIYFESVSPWAYSPVQNFRCNFEQHLSLNSDGVLIPTDSNNVLNITDDGVLYNSTTGGAAFQINESGVTSIDNSVDIQVDNKTDDLYTYIYLNVVLMSFTSDYLSIKNKTLNEETIITGMSANEMIQLKPEQFIISSVPNKIFGDDFNFVWPRLKPGINKFSISGSGSGDVTFSYRYPIKIGDCTIDSNELNYDDC